MLGLVRRNVARHLPEAGLAVASVAVAAALVTAALMLRHGLPASFDPALRAYLGGDVLVWAGEAPAPAEGRLARAAAPGGLRLAPVPADGTVDLALFWPDLVPGAAYLTRDPLALLPAPGLGAPAALAADPALARGAGFGGARWYPRLALPARAGESLVWLVARFPGQADADLWRTLSPDGWPAEMETAAARAPGAGPPATLDAVVPKGSAASSDEPIDLAVPTLAGRGEAGLLWDWTRVREVGLAVRGRYELPLGDMLACTAPGCPPPGRLGPTYVQPAWPAQDVFVPWAEWLALWRAVAGEAEPVAREWAVRLRDPGRARDFARAVRATGFGTAATVHDLWGSATARAQLATPEEAAFLASRGATVGYVLVGGGDGGAGGGLPPVVWRAAGPAHLALPSPWLGWLSLLLAALILGGQMVALVGRRRKELGVLLALGASPGAVIGLVAAEALAYAVVGSLAGYAAMTLFTLPSTAAGASVGGWLAEAALRLGEVLLAAAGAAVVSTLAPAALAATTRVTEVIRDE